MERKTARGGTAGGERYVRVRLTLGAPRYLWFGSDKVIVRQLTEHETGSMNSIARRKSFRSQIKLNLKMADPSPSSATVTGSADDAKENGSGAGTGFPAKQMTTVSLQNGFRYIHSINRFYKMVLIYYKLIDYNNRLIEQNSQP